MSEDKVQQLIRRPQSDLPPGEPLDQVRAILERPDAEGYVQSLDPQVLYRLVQSAGFDDAGELVAMASPWQVQVFVDLDVWHKDRFVPDKLVPWLNVLLDQAPDEKLRAVVRETDAETIAMFIKDNIQVGLFDEDGNPPPEFMGQPWTTSLDGVYAVLYPADEDKAALVRQLFDRLYHVDRVMAWTLLEAARWELMSNMEEEAYHWRTSRMEEFGFVSRDEALELYQSVNPAKFRESIENGTYEAKARPASTKATLPALVEEETSAFYLFRIMNLLDDDLLEPLVAELASVQNRAILADGVEPGELDQAKNIGSRTLGYLSLGLEFLARGNDESAHDILEDVPLKDIFRTGFSLTWRLRRTVNDLRRRPTLSIVEGSYFSLLGASERVFLEGLFKVRPVFTTRDGGVQNFKEQAQVDEAAMRLALIAFKQLWLFGAARIEPNALLELAYGDTLANSPDEVTFDAIFATHVVLALLGKKTTSRGLSADEVSELPALLRGRPWGDDPLGYFEDDTVAPVIERLPAASIRFVGPWLRTTLDNLVDELERVHETIEAPTMFTHLLLIEE